MKNYQKILLSVIFMLFSTFLFAENGERVRFQDGNFSICPPAGWQTRLIAGLKYDVVIGPTEDGFSANIVFVDDNYEGNLKDYVDLNLVHLRSIIQDYELADRKAFKTNSGISGEYVIVKHEQYGYYLKQISYFFPVVNNKYFVITCSVLEDFFERYRPLFEDSVKTFEKY
jgi:hypothetical protein